MSEREYWSLEELGVTKTQRRNLEKLYAGTERFLPDPSFDMSRYSQFERPYDDGAMKCGTIACFAGHGPKVGVKPHPDESWEEYVDRVFGKDTGLWNWLFSAAWAHTDGTLSGARTRLRIALDRGVPSDYNQQRWGDVMPEYLPADDES